MTKMRYERKYYFEKESFGRLEQSLSKILKKDAYDDGQGYQVVSLYFDTLGDKDLNDALDGVLSRHKLRLRYYGDEPENFKLELKNKVNEKSYKLSLLLNKNEVEQLLKGQNDFLRDKEDEYAQTFYECFRKEYYKPVIIISYNRKAYEHDTSHLRICFDSNIRYSHRLDTFLKSKQSYIPIDSLINGILEVKYDELVIDPITRVLKSHQLQALGYSKYVNARKK